MSDTPAPDIAGFMAAARAIDRREYNGGDPETCIVGFPTEHDLAGVYQAWLAARTAEERWIPADAPSPREVFMAERFNIPLEHVTDIWRMAATGFFVWNLPMALVAAERILRGQSFAYHPLDEEGHIRHDETIISTNPPVDHVAVGFDEEAETHTGAWVASAAPGARPRPAVLDVDDLPVDAQYEVM